MSRITQAVLAIAVFLGTGFVTRAWFSEWMNTAIKESTKVSESQAANWKSAATQYNVPKLDKPIRLNPQFEPIKIRPSKKQPNMR